MAVFNNYGGSSVFQDLSGGCCSYPCSYADASLYSVSLLTFITVLFEYPLVDGDIANNEASFSFPMHCKILPESCPHN